MTRSDATVTLKLTPVVAVTASTNAVLPQGNHRREHRMEVGINSLFPVYFSYIQRVDITLSGDK